MVKHPDTPPMGWKLLPQHINHKGKEYPVWPANGRAYVKGGETVVFLRESEDRTFAIVSSAADLGDEEAAAVVGELLPGVQTRRLKVSAHKIFEVYPT